MVWSIPLNVDLVGSLSMRVFEMRTATGSELFSLLTCPHTTTFILLSIYSPLEIIVSKSGRQYDPSPPNVLFRLPSASQKRACLSSLRPLRHALRRCVPSFIQLQFTCPKIFNYWSVSDYSLIFAQEFKNSNHVKVKILRGVSGLTLDNKPL